MVYNFDINFSQQRHARTVDVDQFCLSEWTELLIYDGRVNW